MATNDPYSPDYDPRYRHQDDRDVGSGRAFAADTGQLYLAGLEHFPVAAGTYAEACSDVYYVDGLLRSLAATAGRPGIALAADHATVMVTVLDTSSQRLYAAGEALVAIADDFVATDEEVERVMDGLVAKNRDILVHPAPQPPAPGLPA